MDLRLSLLAGGALAALVALGPVPAVAQQNSPGQPLTTTTTESPASPSTIAPADLDFVLKAAMGGMEEVALGGLAEQKAASEEVKRLAAHIVQEHTTANQELVRTAEAKGIKIPETTSPVAQTVAASLSELNGPDFDMQYVLQQHGAHLATIAMFQHASMHTMDADVRAFAQKYLPKIQAHTAEIEKVGMAMMNKTATTAQ
jgi:putative membrane protein